MKVLLLTDNTDELHLFQRLVESESQIEVVIISDCEQASTVLSKPHDLVMIDDSQYRHLSEQVMKMLERSRIDVMVILKEKSHVQRYLTLNLLAYFVMPFNWTEAFQIVKQVERRLQLLSYLEPPKLDRYVIRNREGIFFLPYEDILFFQKIEKHVNIHTRERVFRVTDSLKNVQEPLPDNFMRVHSSYIVNFDNVSQIIEEHRTYTIRFDHYQNVAHMSRKKAEEMKRDVLNRHRLDHIQHIRKDR